MDSSTDAVLLDNGHVGPLSRQECRTIVRRCLSLDNFEMLDIKIAPRSAHIIGFMGEHWMVDISVRVQQESTVDLKFFAKTIPINLDEHALFVSSSGAYVKETLLYSTLLKDFQKYYGKRLGPVDTGMSKYQSKAAMTCECFYTRPDIVVLEDLSVYNFRCMSSRVPMDWKHCAVVLGGLARFHAATILYEEEHQCRIDEAFPEVFFETLFVSEDSPTRDWLLAGLRSTLAVADLLGKYGKDSEVHRRVTAAFTGSWDCVTPSEKYRNVLCHADLWSTNIQFRYVGDDDASDPVEVRFVDFQIARYAPPAHDVSSFLLLTTTRAFRDAHLEELLEMYYKTLYNVLFERGVLLDGFLTWKEFRESYDFYKLSALLICSTYCPSIIDARVGNVFESSEKFRNYVRVDRNQRVVDGFNTDPVIRERMTDIVEELIEVLFCK